MTTNGWFEISEIYSLTALGARSLKSVSLGQSQGVHTAGLLSVANLPEPFFYKKTCDSTGVAHTDNPGLSILLKALH